tara:strand:- start:2971 stop:3177 length:207 start_codon:yes stop_codon:yes gene_type:complete
MVNHDNIKLKTISKKFQYSNISRRLDKINDISVLKGMIRYYVKLHLYHEEMMKDLMSKHREISWSKDK